MLHSLHPAFVILDAPTFEGEAVSPVEYLRWIGMLRPNAVIVPDVRFDCAGTLEFGRHYLRSVFSSNRQYETIGVPQGQTLDEWLKCLRGLLELGIDIIGVVEETETWATFEPLMDAPLRTPGRLGVLEAMARAVPESRDKPIHLLGLSENPTELFWIEHRYPGWVQSCDSAKGVV
jgi:hypothetical protein